MRCSLLVLSGYLDSELEPARRGELEAHLVGCTRCSTALGYLREESERLGGLARVHVPDQAAQQLFAELALIAPEQELPGEAQPRSPRPAISTPAPPWLGDQPGKALPWMPQPPPPRGPDRDDLLAAGHRAAIGLATPPDQRAVPIDQLATPDRLVTAAPDQLQMAVEPPAPLIEVEVPGLPLAPGPVAPPVPPRRATPGPLQRIRDAIAVRFALMSGGKLDVDDSVEIVHGPAPPPHEIPPPLDLLPAAQPPVEATVSAPGAAMAEHVPIEAHTPIQVAPVRPATGPTVPGRHTRSLHGRGRTMPRPWTSWAASARSLRSLSPARPAVGVPPSDQRLWVFAAATVALMVVGLLVGKSVSTPRVTGTAQHAAGGPNGRTGVPGAAPSAAATPLPTPTPPPSPSVLTGTKTLGGVSSGFVLSHLRYGTHPHDFRIVLDFNNDSARGAAPTVIAGFGNPTTLYIELVNVAPAATTPEPLAGNMVTAVRLLSPSPIAGRSIYEMTLAHPVKLSEYYLSNPVRLVIDLT